MLSVRSLFSTCSRPLHDRFTRSHRTFLTASLTLHPCFMLFIFGCARRFRPPQDALTGSQTACSKQGHKNASTATERHTERNRALFSNVNKDPFTAEDRFLFLWVHSRSTQTAKTYHRNPPRVYNSPILCGFINKRSAPKCKNITMSASEHTPTIPHENKYFTNIF